MKNVKIFTLLSLLLFVMASCGGSGDEPVKDYLKISVDQIGSTGENGGSLKYEAKAQAATLQIKVASNGSWQVAVQGNPDWLKVSPVSGSGNGVVSVNILENKGEERSADVQVFSASSFAKLVVSQEKGADSDKPEEPSYTSIADVKAKYKETDTKLTITDDITICGIVISDFRKTTDGGLLNNYTSAKTMVVADETAGIQLYCAADNKDFARGDKVAVKLKGQVLSVYNKGAIQVDGIPLANITKIGTETPVAKEITAAELVSGKFESMYVAVKDVQVTTEDKGKTFATADSHVSIAFEAKTGEGFDLFSSKYSTFKDEKVPEGSGTLKGIAGVYGDTYQIVISEKADYSGLTGERFSTGARFTVNGTSAIETSVSGDAGKYTVELVAKEVEWSANSNNDDFKLSKTSGKDATEEITISYTNNTSTTDSRTAVITFTTTNAEVKNKTLTVTIRQAAYEALVSDAVNAWLELPEVKEQEGFAYISHDIELKGNMVRNYSYWLDGNNRIANWVAYPMYKDIAEKNTTRPDKDVWTYDPKVPKRCQPVLVDRGWGVDGYARGHQLPSADRLHSKAANESTFYCINATAQNSSFNGGLWLDLENRVRNWSAGCDTLYVVTGAVTTTKGNTTVDYIKDNSGNNVAIPKAYYKVILRYKKADGAANGGYSAIGFWFENKKPSGSSMSATDAKTVDAIEELTGFNFFHNLDNTIENAVEKEVKVSEWGL